MLGSVMSACGSDTTGPALSPAYWAIQLNQHAVTLALAAPHNTIQLSVISSNSQGDTVPIRDVVRYSVSDSIIRVDSTGLVTAQFVTRGSTPSFVVASLTNFELQQTVVDTCFIRVTYGAPASQLAHLSIQPAEGKTASAALTIGTSIYRVGADATDSDGDAFTGGLLVRYSSSDPSIATIDGSNGTVVASRAGHVTFYAQTWAYGIAARDSLPFDITLPIRANISVLPVFPTGQTSPIFAFWPQAVTVGRGATVNWSNDSYTDSVDVVFDDPTNVDSVRFDFGRADFSTGQGNIEPWVRDTLGTGFYSARILQYSDERDPSYRLFFGISVFAGQRSRAFPVAGTYHYHSKKWGTTGTIYVQ